MKPRRQSKNDSIFSWNNPSANIEMVTWESGRRINIRIFERNRNREFRNQSTEGEKLPKLKSNRRTRSLPYNAYAKLDIPRYLRQLRYSIELEPEKRYLTEGTIKVSRELIIKRFKDFVAKIQFLMKIFQRIFMYAMEKGEHDKITSDPRLRLKGHQADLNPDKDILFDPERFKTDFQGFFPKWAKIITRKVPEERTEEEIDSLVKLLKQLKQFRRYTHDVQRLMCKVVRYDRFERHRVIIRKGHVGRCFYIIYSGIVCFTLSEDDQKVLSNTSGTEYYNLYKGDSFGELALLRDVRRAATIVCLQRSEFLSVEREDFYNVGIVDILRSEMDHRVAFLRGLDLFSTWPSDLLRKVAQECRTLEFRSDLVIDRNLMISDMVYVVTKGKCHLLRLLDLTNSKKWVKKRRHQKKLYGSVFPDNVSSPCSRQGTFSRLSAFSNVTGFYDQNITRLRSHPQLPRQTPRPESRHPRMVKSAFAKTERKTDQKCGSDCKQDVSDTRHVQQPASVRNKSACSKMDSELRKFGAGVFLRVDVIEKGEIAGLRGILRTDEDTASKSSSDTRRFYLVSKGCQVISLPVEVLKKHGDFETLKKVEKQTKEYPKDEELLDCYLEKSDWNTYKEVLLCKMVKEIETRKYSGKPGTTLRTNSESRYEERARCTASRLETRKTYDGRRSTTSQRERSLDQNHSKSTRILCSPSPIAVQSTYNESFCYPYKPSGMIYAKGSHRSLVLVNGGIGTNMIQEELEEHLFSDEKFSK